MLKFQLIYRKIYNLISTLINIIAWKNNLKRHLNLKFIRWNFIGTEGAAKLSESLSKLTNLTTLNLNFG